MALSRLKFGLVFLLLLLVSQPLQLRGQEMMDPVSFRVILGPDTVKTGEKFSLDIQANIEGDWHLYSIDVPGDKGPFPTKFTTSAQHLYLADSVSESEPERAYDPNFKMEVGWHSRRASYNVPLYFGKDIGQGEALVDVAVEYQVCNDQVCLPPTTKQVTHSVIIDGEAEGALRAASGEVTSGNNSDVESSEKAAANETEASNGSINAQKGNIGGSGILSFLWIAITAGFAALLTPCVFPMLPLTVSYFTKQSRNTHRQAVSQALFFGLSIVLTFTVLGVALALIIGASGAAQFASDPWVNLFIGVVLVVFAFSLLGLFELRLPHQFTNWLNQKSSEESGILGVVFMGLTISAVSFSCTAPFVGGVLVATTGGEWFYPILGMIAFSAAFSTPFIVFALFPRWLESIPKSGSWMNVVKVLLGFIELAAAFKFLSNADLVWEWGVITRPLTIAAWIVIFALAGIYTLGYLRIGDEGKRESVHPLRVLIAIPLLTFSIYLIPGLLGSNLGIWDAWLPPKKVTDVGITTSISQSGAGTEGRNAEEDWMEHFDKAVARGQQENKPVFIDFTGYTCTNCRAMESNVFPRQRVQTNFSKMVKLRLYTDAADRGPENRKLQFNLTGTVALPTYVILNPHTEKVVEQISGYTDVKSFAKFLETGLSNYNSIAGKK